MDIFTQLIKIPNYFQTEVRNSGWRGVSVCLDSNQTDWHQVLDSNFISDPVSGWCLSLSLSVKIVCRICYLEKWSFSDLVGSDLEDAGWLILRVRRGKMKFEFGPLIFFVESPLCLRILFQSSIIDIGLLYCTPQLELYKKVWDSVRNWFRLELIWFDS
jgi:hypothetical protein